MKIALPVTGELLSRHFGHSDLFSFYEYDDQKKTFKKLTDAVPPVHEPGILPEWLAENKINLVITGGIGSRAANLLENNCIKIISGAEPDIPDVVLSKFSNGDLKTGKNTCYH